MTKNSEKILGILKSPQIEIFLGSKERDFSIRQYGTSSCIKDSMVKY